MRAVREERSAAWAKMYAAGVRFATGPDTGIPDTYWGNLAWDLGLMVEHMGVSPVDAIAAATHHSAVGLRLEQDSGRWRPERSPICCWWTAIRPPRSGRCGASGSSFAPGGRWRTPGASP